MTEASGVKNGLVLGLVVGLLLVFLMPSQQSLWIDECTTASYARTPDLASFIEKLVVIEKGSDAQYPLGNLYYWVGSKVVGTSELALRSLSALWVVAALVILWRIGSISGLLWLTPLFACHPFVWFYAGEARPYTMQLAFGAGLLYSVVAVIHPSGNTTRGVKAFFIFGFLLCATCMLGVIPVAVVSCVVISALIRQSWRPTVSDWLIGAIAVGLAMLLGLYYAWTLIEGKGAQTVGTWGVGLKNLVFAIYEILGFGGFGPGRYNLRQLALEGGLWGAATGFLHLESIGALILAAVYLWAALRFAKNWWSGTLDDRRIGVTVIGVFAGTAGILTTLAAIVDFPFWGRHMAPVLPFAVCWAAVAVDPPKDKHRAMARPAALLCATLLLSSLMLRFDSEHHRDDYRLAADIALSAVESGQTVWWSASDLPAAYYGLQFCCIQQRRTGCVFNAINQDAETLSLLPTPDLVLLSKPDLFDTGGALRAHLSGNEYRIVERFSAFQAYRPHHEVQR